VGDGEAKWLRRTSAPKPMPSHRGRYDSSSPGIPASQTGLQLELPSRRVGGGRRRGACTEGEAEDGEVDLLLLMGRVGIGGTDAGARPGFGRRRLEREESGGGGGGVKLRCACEKRHGAANRISGRRRGVLLSSRSVRSRYDAAGSTWAACIATAWHISPSMRIYALIFLLGPILPGPYTSAQPVSEPGLGAPKLLTNSLA
jgi:hypothetical protein